MKKVSTHFGHAFDRLEYVKFVMNEILNGTKVEEIKKKFVDENPFGIKSENARKTYINWIVKGYVKGFKLKELKLFAKVITDKNVHPQIKKEIMFWKNCRSDDLARAITIDFIFERFQNVKPFTRNELFDFISKNTSSKPSTVKKMMSGYLSVISEMNIVSTKKEKYEFNFYRPHLESFIFVLFYLLSLKRTPDQVLHSKDFKYLLVTDKYLLFYLREVQHKGFISFAIAGDIIRIEPKIEFEAVLNELGS